MYLTDSERKMFNFRRSTRVRYLVRRLLYTDVSTIKPPLYEVHEAAGAAFTDFGGWLMPVTFDSIRQEHRAVREAVGIFDVSHMSEITVDGPDASTVLDLLTTNDVRALDPGDAQYSCILDESGTILDDTVVYRYPERDGYLFVPNAGHGEQMQARCRAVADRHELTATVTDETHDIGLVAVQGPDAVETVDELAEESLEDLGRFRCVRATVASVPSLVARTGYTGEDGFEIFFDADDAETMWKAFEAVQSCGLGARDTLRLEAGLLLSGQDFDPDEEPRTPLEAGLDFVVEHSKPEFIGKDALAEQRRSGADERMVGLRIDGRGIARHGYTITVDGSEVGHVTSGTMSPTFGVPLALGYVENRYSEVGTTVDVQIRSRDTEATVVDQRFLNTLETK